MNWGKQYGISKREIGNLKSLMGRTTNKKGKDVIDKKLNNQFDAIESLITSAPGLEEKKKAESLKDVLVEVEKEKLFRVLSGTW